MQMKQGRRERVVMCGFAVTILAFQGGVKQD